MGTDFYQGFPLGLNPLWYPATPQDALLFAFAILLFPTNIIAALAGYKFPRQNPVIIAILIATVWWYATSIALFFEHGHGVLKGSADFQYFISFVPGVVYAFLGKAFSVRQSLRKNALQQYNTEQ